MSSAGRASRTASARWARWPTPTPDRTCYDMAHQQPGSMLVETAAGTPGLPFAYGEAFVAEIDGDDPPAAPAKETAAVIGQARDDAQVVLAWLHEVGRLWPRVEAVTLACRRLRELCRAAGIDSVRPWLLDADFAAIMRRVSDTETPEDWREHLARTDIRKRTARGGTRFASRRGGTWWR